ncbi:MAG: hypothetical protein E7548_07005 [Ruminococcaceae bacterium]|nr:hypothetical protein [Oscillospiraceae bacterium]
MKKFLCIFLAALLCITCFAGCGKKNTDVTSSGTVSGSDFVKPENYASVVVVTINPQFKLYLDASGVVLAVEPVNDDAKSIEDKVTFENKKVEEVVNNLIVAANDGGFVKADATIDIKITEIVDEKVDTTAILNTITTSTNTKLAELEITAEVKTAVEIEKEEVTSSESSTSSEAPACKHEKTKAVPASTGKNIIDSSKLDVVNHNKVCTACNATVGTEKHTIKNGKCSVCGQSNFATASVNLEDAGISGGPSGHCAAEINSDGTPDFDYMMQEGYYAIDFDTLNKYLNDSDDDWMFEIPEAVFYNALKTKFVINDSLFAKLKAQGKYEFFWCNHSYSNGTFFIPYMAAGDVAEYTHQVLGYKDNKNGSFTVYYDYFEGGPDVEPSERVHKFYYAMEYTYSGASNLSIEKVVENDYEYHKISGWKPVVDSLRIKSIKKVTDISGLTTVK